MQDVRRLQQEHNQTMEAALVSLGLMTEEELLDWKARQANVPLVRIHQHYVNPQVVKRIPRKLAERLKIFPLRETDSKLTLAMADPSNLLIIDEVHRLTNLRIIPVAAAESDILNAIVRYYSGELDERTRAELKQKADQPQEKAMVIDRLQQVVEEAPVISTVNSILHAAITERASDIHIECHEQEMVVRYRVDGVLYDFMTPARELHAPLISRLKIMAGMNIAERRLPQDGRFPVKVDGKDYDVRASTVPGVFGEKVVLRLLSKDKDLLQLEHLGLNERNLALMEELIERPYGMVLVSGPTGSGKSTTLYAALSRVDSIRKNVITIEDPVEYQLPRVTQIQVHPKAGLTFALGLRHILRQDPDIIMVGEIRDTETLQMAIQASLTGHLVFSTVHCNDAAAAAARLIDMGMEPFLITSSVIGIVAQRLVRRICPHCREPYRPSEELCRRLGLPDPNVLFFRGRGCSDCRDTGYHDRISVFEILIPTQKMREAILRRESASTIRQLAREAGVPSLQDDGLEKVLAGVTSVEEVLRAVYVEEE